MPSPVASDLHIRATDDRLAFKRYVDPLVDILTAPDTTTPFTVGIFGTWGSGKTSLIRLLDERLEEKHRDRFVRVHFNAWVHRKEPSMLVPLLHTVRDTLESSPAGAFASSAKKLGDVLARLGAGLLLKGMTFGQVSVKDLDKLEKEYLARTHQVQSELRNLRKTLAATAKGLGKGVRLVLFIDDLDRCQPDEIIDLLEAVKLFLDVEGGSWCWRWTRR